MLIAVLKTKSFIKTTISVCLILSFFLANTLLASPSLVSDKKYLTQEQYKRSDKYQKRLAVFQYGNQPPLLAWASSMHQQAYHLEGKKILEIGAGTCEFWEHSLKNATKDSTIVITDISQGMLHDCQKHLNKLKTLAQLSYAITDIDHLEHYPSDSFDVVIAHFVIYHAKDPQKALNELYRILKPHGLLALGIVDEASSQGLWALGNQFDDRVPLKGFTSVFCERQIEENALLNQFSHCNTKHYINQLSFPMSARNVPIDSFKTSPTIAGLNLSENVFQQMERAIINDVKKKGSFEYQYLARLYFCEK